MKRRSLSAVLALIFVLSTVVTLFALPTSAVDAKADVWDGETVTIGWYTEHSEEDTYTLTKASDLAGLSYLVAHRSGAIYYEEATGKVDPTVKETKEGFAELKKGNLEAYKTYKNIPILSFPGKTIQLGADLDMGGKPFTPIGATASFGGNFDGAGHTVKNITVDNAHAKHGGGSFYFGMFGTIAWEGSVKNLTIENEVLAIGSEIGNNVWVGAGGVLALVSATGGATISDVTVRGLTVTVDTPANPPRNNRIELGGIAGQIQFKGEEIGKNVKVLCMTVTSTWEDGNILTGSAGKYYGYSSSDKDAAFADCSVTMGHGEAETAWSSDGTNHWHKCSVCGSPLDSVKHTMKEVVDKEATETEAGSKHSECTVCGYKTASKSIPATGSGSAPSTGDATLPAVILLAGCAAIGCLFGKRRKSH